MHRSVSSLLLMLGAFILLIAIFVALDVAAGVHLAVPLFVPTASGPTAPRVATVVTRKAAPATPRTPASLQRTPTTSTAITTPITTTATPMPPPLGGVTPPRYGAASDYPNNAHTTVASLHLLDQQIIDKTNVQRARYGLPPLTEDPRLDSIAASRSQDLIQRNYFDHLDPTGPLDASGHHIAAIQELLQRNGILYSEVGENLINRIGFVLDKTTPDSVVTAWMGHPEHRANILHGSYRNIGVGIAAQNDAEGLRVVVTQIFTR